MDSFIGEQNRLDIDSYLAAPSHGLIVFAPKGFGKSSVLDYIASRLLDSDNFTNNPSYKEIKTEENSIGIDSIRDVKKYLKLKQSVGSKRVIVVHDCHKMTIESQNSFLKLLEEPPSNTYILMSADGTARLLPTIKSRVRLMPLKAPSKEEVCQYFIDQGLDKKAVERAFLMTGGLVNAMQNLLDDPTKQHAFDQAKTVLSSSTYARLLMVDTVSKDKVETATLLNALKRTLLAMLHSGDLGVVQTKKVHKSLSVVAKAEELISGGSPNLKLVLSNMMLSM